jgi:hypothetical protein
MSTQNQTVTKPSDELNPSPEGLGLGESHCSVCADVLRRLGGHDCSRLDGEHGLAAATMRSHEALLRVVELHENWEIRVKNQNNIVWNKVDAGKTIQLVDCIKELRAAINNSLNVPHHLPRKAGTPDADTKGAA